MKDDDFKLLKGFALRRTDKQTEICDCRVAFATEKSVDFFHASQPRIIQSHLWRKLSIQYDRRALAGEIYFKCQIIVFLLCQIIELELEYLFRTYYYKKIHSVWKLD